MHTYGCSDRKQDRIENLFNWGKPTHTVMANICVGGIALQIGKIKCWHKLPMTPVSVVTYSWNLFLNIGIYTYTHIHMYLSTSINTSERNFEHLLTWMGHLGKLNWVYVIYTEFTCQLRLPSDETLCAVTSFGALWRNIARRGTFQICICLPAKSSVTVSLGGLCHNDGSVEV